MNGECASWTYIEKDSVVSDQPSLLFGVIVNGSSNGAYVDLYAGQDADSGSKIARVQVLANVSWEIFMARPVVCGRGIYVDLGTNIDSVTVIWAPFSPC